MRRTIALLIAVIFVMAMFGGCSTGGYTPKNTTLDKNAAVTIKIASDVEANRAIEYMAEKFKAIYKNVQIEYEYIQDYYEMLPLRLQTEDCDVDLFFTSNIQPELAHGVLQPYALDLFSIPERLDITNAHPGLVENFKYTPDRGTDHETLYAIPLTGEMRGMYVNKTILNSLNLKTPTNFAELLSACEVLKEAGYVPLQSNPGDFAQTLMYPYVCSMVINDKELYAKTEARAVGLGELFRDPLTRLYTITENHYYDYNAVKEQRGEYKPSQNDAKAKFFLNIMDDGSGTYAKVDDTGFIPFLTGTMSFKEFIDRVAQEYDSKIEYEFILSPVGDDGGYAYLSPGKGIAINKNSQDFDWAVEFMNFLLTPEYNTMYAEKVGQVPNRSDALEYVVEKYPGGKGRAFHLGEATFSYNFYSVIVATLTNVSKCNNPKYMVDDGSGNLTLPTLDSFVAELEAGFQNVNAEG